MRKIIALWQNEMIKTFKKVSIIILTALLIPAIFGIGGFFKLIGYIDESYTIDEEYRQQELEMFKEELSKYEKELKDTSPEDKEYASIIDNIYSMKEAITVRELCNKMELDTYFSSNWLNEAINEYAFALSAIQRDTVHDPEYLSDNEFKRQTKHLALKEIIEERDYKKYIDLKKEEIKSSSYSATEKEFELKALDYRLKCDPEGINQTYSIDNAINTLREYNRSLESGINYTVSPQVPLSVTQEKQFKNAVSALEYKLNSGLIKPSASENSEMATTLAVPGMISVGASVVLILLIILAGGSVSQEMSSGSIKSLIISPTKRWKIFAAKYLSILTVGVGTTLIASALTVVSALIWYGPDSLVSYVYAVNGVPHEINGVIYVFAQQFVELIEIVIFSTFAFMLSVVTRNTAASVCVSVVIYYLGSTATGMLAAFGISGEWVKFIPFNNTSMLATQFFPFSDLNNILSELTVSATPTLTFSLIYISVIMICMLYTAFDSFTRRDI